MKKKHGGARDGAGRPPKSEGAKVPYSTRLSARVVEYLRQSINASKVIDDAIADSKPFKVYRLKRK